MVENRFDLAEQTVLDFKHLGDLPGERANGTGGLHAAVGELNKLRVSGMIEEDKGEHQGAFLINQHKTAVAYPRHKMEKSRFELRFAAQGFEIKTASVFRRSVGLIFAVLYLQPQDQDCRFAIFEDSTEEASLSGLRIGHIEYVGASVAYGVPQSFT